MNRRPLLAAAVAAHRAGRFPEAIELYAGLLAAEPADFELRRLYGVALLQAGQVEAAVVQFERLIAVAPENADTLSNLGTALRRTLRLGDALAAARRAAAIRPNDPVLQFNLGNAAAEVGACAEAEAAYGASLALRPDHRGALLGRGHMQRALGRQAEALDSYRACLALDPSWGDAWWSIANIKTQPLGAAAMAQLRRQLDRGDLPTSSRAPMLYALAKGLDDAGDYLAAFTAYSEGAALMRGDFDGAAHQLEIARLIRLFEPGFLAARSGWGCSEESPIFILGLPRSGSTLIEQILASHDDVEGIGELPYMPELAGRLGLDGLAAMTASQAAALGRRYLALAGAHRAGRPVFIDKLPNNFLHIGFIRLILPRARIIDARRHPLDSCVGTFKQYFARGQPFSYSLEDLAAWYEGYDRLMAHWQAIDIDVIRVDYERLVLRLDPTVRSLAHRLGLAWQPQMLEFHRTSRAVLSASADQVRVPIYPSALHAWTRYRAALQPWIQRLDLLLATLPEDVRQPPFPESGKAG